MSLFLLIEYLDQYHLLSLQQYNLAWIQESKLAVLTAPTIFIIICDHLIDANQVFMNGKLVWMIISQMCERHTRSQII